MNIKVIHDDDNNDYYYYYYYYYDRDDVIVENIHDSNGYDAINEDNYNKHDDSSIYDNFGDVDNSDYSNESLQVFLFH